MQVRGRHLAVIMGITITIIVDLQVAIRATIPTAVAKIITVQVTSLMNLS